MANRLSGSRARELERLGGQAKAAKMRAAKGAPAPFAGTFLDVMDAAGLAGPIWEAWGTFWRAWATARKGLSLKDVAEAGGWKDTTTLLKCYAPHADPETLAAVVMHDAPARAAR